MDTERITNSSAVLTNEDSRQETYSQPHSASVEQLAQLDKSGDSPIDVSSTLTKAVGPIMTTEARPPQASSTLNGLNAEDIHKRPLPSLTFDRSIRPFLGGGMRLLAIGIEGLIRNAVQRSHAEVSGITITQRTYRNFRGVELKFTVHTQMNSEQAFALWDSIGASIEDWRTRLSPPIQRLLDEQVAISVEWKN